MAHHAHIRLRVKESEEVDSRYDSGFNGKRRPRNSTGHKIERYELGRQVGHEHQNEVERQYGPPRQESVGIAQQEAPDEKVQGI